jgi:hypothetical protein
MMVRMPVSRRRFILVTALSACWAMAGRLFGAIPRDVADFELGLLAWVETLLPSDAVSPGAGRLNVHLEIIAKAEANARYVALLRAGIVWADAEARKRGKARFVELDTDAMEAVVSGAESMGLKTVPGLFFHHTLKDGSDFYYGHKESWASVGFPHPPQPIGFLAYTEAPG